MNILLTTILSAVFMSGIALLQRICADLVTSEVLPKKILTKIGTVLRFFYFCVIVSVFFLNLKMKWMIFWVLIVASILFLLLFFYFKKIKDTKITNADWLCFVEDMLLLMRSGKGFRETLRLSLQTQPKRFKSYYNRWIEHVVFLQQGMLLDPNKIPLAVLRLCVIDEKPHEAMARLTAWREEIRLIEKFRRKSGQALYSFRFQSLVVLVIYFAASVYSFAKYSSAMVLPFFLASLLWLFIGGGIFFRWSRKTKWKV